jgi:hypothetical protein
LDSIVGPGPDVVVENRASKWEPLLYGRTSHPFQKEASPQGKWNINGMGNGAFLAVVTVPRINNLRAVNMVISSTPAASTNNFVYYQLLAYNFNFVQQVCRNCNPESVGATRGVRNQLL